MEMNLRCSTFFYHLLAVSSSTHQLHHILCSRINPLLPRGIQCWRCCVWVLVTKYYKSGAVVLFRTTSREPSEGENNSAQWRRFSFVSWFFIDHSMSSSSASRGAGHAPTTRCYALSFGPQKDLCSCEHHLHPTSTFEFSRRKKVKNNKKKTLKKMTCS